MVWLSRCRQQRVDRLRPRHLQGEGQGSATAGKSAALSFATLRFSRSRESTRHAPDEATNGTIPRSVRHGPRNSMDIQWTHCKQAATVVCPVDEGERQSVEKSLVLAFPGAPDGVRRMGRSMMPATKRSHAVRLFGRIWQTRITIANAPFGCRCVAFISAPRSEVPPCCVCQLVSDPRPVYVGGARLRKDLYAATTPGRLRDSRCRLLRPPS